MIIEFLPLTLLASIFFCYFISRRRLEAVEDSESEGEILAPQGVTERSWRKEIRARTKEYNAKVRREGREWGAVMDISQVLKFPKSA